MGLFEASSARGDFTFTVDVSETCPLKKQALAEYKSPFQDERDQLLELYEADNAYMGRLFGLAYTEVFKSHSSLLVADPTVFLPALYAWCPISIIHYLQGKLVCRRP
jgi:N-acetylglucosamine malate deacetylase 1